MIHQEKDVLTLSFISLHSGLLQTTLTIRNSTERGTGDELRHRRKGSRKDLLSLKTKTCGDRPWWIFYRFQRKKANRWTMEGSRRLLGDYLSGKRLFGEVENFEGDRLCGWCRPRDLCTLTQDESQFLINKRGLLECWTKVSGEIGRSVTIRKRKMK